MSHSNSSGEDSSEDSSGSYYDGYDSGTDGYGKYGLPDSGPVNRGNPNLELLLKEVNRKNEASLDAVKKNLSQILQHVSLNDFHIASCVCGCGVKDTFWNCIEYASIRLDILRYLFESKVIDLENPKQRQNILGIFAKVLANSGVENTDGMSARIHEVTLFFFELFAPYLDDVRSYVGTYNESLVHSAFYGHHHDRKVEYVTRLLDIGCIPHLTQCNRDDDTRGSDTILNFVAQNSNLFGSSHEIGQSVIYLAACGEFSSLLERIVAKDSPLRAQLNSYNSFSEIKWEKHRLGSDGSERYMFTPIVLHLLSHFSDSKKPEWFESLANDIKILIKSGYDITLPVYYFDIKGISQGHGKSHNITDFLNHYKYKYPGSPVMKLFEELGIQLPEPSDPNEELFWDDRAGRYDDKFEKVLKKHKYTKDPSKFQEIIDELEKVEKDCEDPSFYSSWWTAVSIFDEYSKKLSERKSERMMARFRKNIQPIEEVIEDENEDE